MTAVFVASTVCYSGSLLDEAKVSFSRSDYAVSGHYLEEYLSSGADIELDQERIDYMRLAIMENVDSFKHVSPALDFIEKYPKSMYLNAVLSYLGSAYHMNGDYEKAVQIFNMCNAEQLDIDNANRKNLHHAIAYICLDSLDNAVVLLNTLVYSDPRYDVHSDYYKGIVSYKQGRYDDAVEFFSYSKSKSIYKIPSLLYLAEIALISQDYDQATLCAEPVINSKTDSATIWQAQRITATALFHKKEYAQSAAILAPYMSNVKQSDRSDHYYLGMDYFYLGQYTEAIEQLQYATLQNDAMSENAYLHIGLAALQLKDMSRAEIAFQLGSAIDLDPALNEQLLYNYAMTLYETSFSPFSDAVTVFETFINKYPKSKNLDKASKSLIDVYENSTNYSNAIASIEKLNNPPKNVIHSKQLLYFRRGNVYYGSGDYKNAIMDYTSSIALRQYDKELAEKAYLWRGEAYFALGQYQEAKKDYQSAIDATVNIYGQDYMMSTYGHAYSAYKMRDFESARNEWKSMLSHPSMPDMSKSIQSDVNARVADCFFAVKQYDEAAKYYTSAMELSAENGDYLYYQLALLSGLERNYQQKADYMGLISSRYPNSPIRLSALYEQARTYQQMDKGQDAIDIFDKIITESPSSQIAAKSMLEKAHICNQIGSPERAIETFELVVNQFPGSQEAQTALKDLRNLYVDLGRVDDYVKFSKTVQGVTPIAAGELDSLTYISAERNFTRSNYKEAKTAFQNYLKQFKKGQYVTNAHYYLGRIAQNEKKNSEALDQYAQAASNKHHRFGQEAMQQAATLAFSLGKYELAFNNYKNLYELQSGTKKTDALYGLMRSSYRGKDYKTVLEYADKALGGKPSNEVRLEMLYYKTKSTIELQGLDKSVALLEELSSDTHTEYGAEGNYLYCLYLYEYALYAKCNERILKFVQSGSQQQYWIARCLILLSDSYYAQGKQIEAKQYLLSLKQNYKVKNDDIQTLIGERLQKIEAKDSIMHQVQQ